MHAVVATVSVEDAVASRARLGSEREPLISRASGPVDAYWLEPVDGIGMSVLIFESEDLARKAATYPMPPMEGVTLLALTVREVFAHVGTGR